MNDYSRFSDTELLTKLVGVRQTHQIYKGSIASMFTSKKAPAKCSIARELMKRLLREELQFKAVLNSPNTVKDYLRINFFGQEFESFVALLLDSQHRLIAVEELFRGTLTQTSVYPREVVKCALSHNAGAIIFAHNHPSGVAEASQSDRNLTDALKQALGLIDVRVIDHFIVAGVNVFSFAERGHI